MSRDAQSAKIANALKGSGELDGQKWPCGHCGSEVSTNHMCGCPGAVRAWERFVGLDSPDIRRLDTACEDYGEPGNSSFETYARARDICVMHYVSGNLKPGVFDDAINFLFEAGKRGDPAPDYIFADEGGLWFEWTDGRREVVGFRRKPSYFYFSLLAVCALAVLLMAASNLLKGAIE